MRAIFLALAIITLASVASGQTIQEIIQKYKDVQCKVDLTNVQNIRIKGYSMQKIGFGDLKDIMPYFFLLVPGKALNYTTNLTELIVTDRVAVLTSMADTTQKRIFTGEQLKALQQNLQYKPSVPFDEKILIEKGTLTTDVVVIPTWVEHPEIEKEAKERGVDISSEPRSYNCIEIYYVAEKADDWSRSMAYYFDVETYRLVRIKETFSSFDDVTKYTDYTRFEITPWGAAFPFLVIHADDDEITGFTYKFEAHGISTNVTIPEDAFKID